MEDREELAREIRDVAHLLRETVEELRAISRNLRDAPVPQQLHPQRDSRPTLGR